MNNHDGFLQMIMERPDENHNRVVYADWLKDRGDPLGDFVGAQCELASKVLSSPIVRGLWQDMQADLAKKHARQWADDSGFYDKSVLFCRGFVSHMEYNGVEDLPLLDCSPIESLRIESADIRNYTGLSTDVSRLLKSKRWGAIRELYFDDSITLSVNYMVKWHFKSLRTLVLPWYLWRDEPKVVIEIARDLEPYNLTTLGWNDETNSMEREEYLLESPMSPLTHLKEIVSVKSLSAINILADHYTPEAIVSCP